MLIRTALQTPRWALAFYRRHLLLVLAICLVPAVERFTGQLIERPAPLGVALELLTLAARVLLVVLVVRIALFADPEVGSLSGREVRASLAANAGSLLMQAALLGALFVLADIVPEQAVPALVPVPPLYWAVLLAAKNLTVIPLTGIWMVGVVRQVLLRPRTPGLLESPLRGRG